MKFRPWRERSESNQLAISAKKSLRTVSDYYCPIRNGTNIVRITSFDVTLLNNILTEHCWLSRLSGMGFKSFGLPLAKNKSGKFYHERTNNVQSFGKMELMNSSWSLIHPNFGNENFIRKVTHLVIPASSLLWNRTTLSPTFSSYYACLPGWSYFRLFIRELDAGFLFIQLGLSHCFMFHLTQ